jgi:hypothetical protein
MHGLIPDVLRSSLAREHEGRSLIPKNGPSLRANQVESYTNSIFR